MTQLKLSIKELRNQLENLKFEKQKAVQEAIQNAASEIKDLKSASVLREELETKISEATSCSRGYTKCCFRN